MKGKEEKEEKFNVKINFYGEEIDLDLNFDYNHFVKKISNIFTIPLEQFNSISLSYIDEDGDTIILSTKEDYLIFLQQVKENIVKSIIAEINENSKIDPMICLDSALDYKDKIEKANNQINVENNNRNQDIMNNENNNNNFGINNNKNNIHNILENENNQAININENIKDIIFNYPCAKCSITPIICVLFYCPKCPLFLCEECYKKNPYHEHEITKIESIEKFNKIKEQEEQDKNKSLEERQQKENEQNNNYYYQYFNPNNYFPNDNQNIQSIYNNQNDNRYQFQEYNLPPRPYDNFWPYMDQELHRPHAPQNPQGVHFPFFPLPNHPNIFHQFKEEFKKFYKKKRSGIKNTMNLFQEMKYKRKIHEARKKYNLVGVDDKILFEALSKTNGNIDEAIALLTN